MSLVAAPGGAAYIEGTLSADTTTADAADTTASPPKAGAKPMQARLQPLRRLAPFVLRYPWRLGLTVGFLLIAAIATLIIPALAGQIIDRGFSGELAEAAQLTKQTLGSILDQLERAGYVARVPDPSDGRGRLVTITAAGRELIELSLPVVKAIEAAWAEHLGPTRTRQLREALSDLRTITDPFADVTEVS